MSVMAVDVADLTITDAELAGIGNPYDAALWLAAQVNASGLRVTFLPRAEPA
jgi:hypothetical protein